MDLLIRIMMVVFELIIIFIVSYFVNYYYANWQTEKAKYEHAIIHIEEAIKNCQINNGNYYFIIHQFNDLCKYRYQDIKRNEAAAKAFKKRFWRLHALNGGKI